MHKKTIWFDFENAPQVWVFKEIIKKLEHNGHNIILTARDFSSTISLSKYFGLNPIIVGEKTNSKTNFTKLVSTINRGIELAKFIRNQIVKPVLAISHGSRSLAFASYLSKIKCISLDDYEFSFQGFNYFIDYLLTPFPIEKKRWGTHSKKVVLYPGLKEELYLWNEENYKQEQFDFLSEDLVNVLFRPEGRMTHYSSVKSEILQNKLIEIFSIKPNVKIILIARDKEQESILVKKFKEKNIKFFIPEQILNGPSLINNCDLLIGGGGTMNREAAVLGIPAYSFFGGKVGDVDLFLVNQNKLKIINSEEDITKIKFEKHEHRNSQNISETAYEFVFNFFLQNLV